MVRFGTRKRSGHFFRHLQERRAAGVERDATAARLEHKGSLVVGTVVRHRDGVEAVDTAGIGGEDTGGLLCAGSFALDRGVGIRVFGGEEPREDPLFAVYPISSPLEAVTTLSSGEKLLPPIRTRMPVESISSRLCGISASCEATGPAMARAERFTGIAAPRVAIESK